MKTNAQRRLPLQASRPAYRSLEGWALGMLIEHHAVKECEHHGHALDRSDPDARNRAREAAWSQPFSGATPEECRAAIDEVLRGIGDSCPDC
ncbi:hypothetical protein ABIF38_007407 [Bradyrhizobium japonicum]|jgi:hypothetical protein|uniref:Uncharacterized protein n=1 Tax=Bradyrhizobium elkanii TaxID=29448 RepID=A0ABV4EYW1_BRAEL|nr:MULTISPECIES: hypothetical protein [Bradyrhizobium]MCA1402780.1 hypothetical protein [Bradyrhizobium sp. BRP56]MCP1730279.1 hypothetical protein [Bradyrhizobium elkanii]MCP1757013.1 hypothetical protein [Bradyrhizobium elkanii]MCP1930736.1 hypothetical protein [Bradyrhizobium elkanii]MCP1982526.1 hypothetical protein [Bradyrhizobium elkanii]